MPVNDRNLTWLVANSYPKSLIFSLLLASHGYHRGSLQSSGAIAAALVGYSTLGNSNPAFGVALLSFYTCGTLATKYKRSFKDTLVDERKAIPDVNESKQPDGRDWKQVLCNSWLGTACAIAYRFMGANSAGSTSPYQDAISKSLIYTALGFWSGCAGDTFASELGILSRSRPRLVTNLKKVPPGTNGAVSWLGLGFSALGGLLVGTSSVLIIPSLKPKVPMIIVSGICGLACSLIDSVLGATLQQSLYSKKEKRVISRKITSKEAEKEFAIISGLDFLSNNQVNIVSSTFVGLFTGILTYCSIIP